MPIINGFLLTRQSIDRAEGIDLELWFHTESGPIKVIQTQQQCVFFIEEPKHIQASKLCGTLATQIRPLELKSFNQHWTYGYYFKQQSHMRKAAKLLRENKIDPLEYDVRIADRYLMERFITADTSLSISDTKQALSNKNYTHGRHSNNAKAHGNIHQNIKLSPANPSHQENSLPGFNIASFDIETNYRTGDILSIAVYATNEQRIFMLSEQDHVNDTKATKVAYLSHEKSLLESFLSWMQEFDPDILIGWNCINFDLRMLQRACDKYGLAFTLGRHNSEIEWRTSPANRNHHFTLVPGRAVLDGIDTLKSATFNFESFSLEFVSRSLFGDGKLIHDVDNRGEEIIRLFREDKNALAAYNLEDCRLVWRIFEHCKLIEFAVERARLTGLALDKVGGSVMAFENQYLPRLHRQGYVAPNIPINPVGVGSPGGYVLNSKPGIYNDVLVLDFKSLYPSIIRSFEIDPYGLTEADCQLASIKDHHTKSHSFDTDYDLMPYERDQYSKGYRGAFFKRENNILPELIDKLWQARDKAKQNQNDALSQAIKIIMNSFYGVMGTPGCRFFDRRLPSSITLRGHLIMTRTQELIEQQGYEVIYGDTDSIFVHIPHQVTHSEANDVGNKLAKNITHWWQLHLRENYQLNSALELEFENYFSKFLMPTIRGSEKGSKKRYAGLITRPLFDKSCPKGKDYELIFKGLETVRTDWTLLAREFQKELYRRIFLDLSYEDFIRETLRSLNEGKHDDKLVFRKRLRRKLDDYQRNVPPHVQAAKKADLHYANAGLPQRYEHGGWVSYCYTVNGPETIELRHSALDYELYIERQIIPIVDSILNFHGRSFAEIFSKQLPLI